MRAIDADVLIDEIKKDTQKVIKQDDRVGSFWLGYIAGLVIKQPSIQSEPQWVPCSEKLPEEAGYYITSSEYGGVTVDFYYDNFWNSRKNAYKVLAWMPLPKIYKPNK